MKVINEKLNSQPLFAHAQGLVHETSEWLSIVEKNPTIDKNTLSSEVTVLTFVQGDKNFSLINQLNASGISYVNAIPNNIKFWKNTAKIKYIIPALETVTTPYVLCLDALDILCVEDLSELLPRFLEFDCDMVYNASKLNYPPICKDEEDSESYSPFKFMNAGAFIGKTEAAKEFYQHVYDTQLFAEFKGYENSEQIRVRFGRRHYLKRRTIKVDTECKIFQTLNKAQFEFDFDNNIMTIKK